MVGGSNGNFNYCIVSLLNLDPFCYLEFIIDRASSRLGRLSILHGRANSLDNQIVPVHFFKNKEVLYWSEYEVCNHILWVCIYM